MNVTRSVMNWRASGACLTADPDLFFPISAAGPAEMQIARAKDVCASCQVQQKCLEFALSHDQVYGIWGGTTPEDRQRERRRKRRAAAAASSVTSSSAAPKVATALSAKAQLTGGLAH